MARWLPLAWFRTGSCCIAPFSCSSLRGNSLFGNSLVAVVEWFELLLGSPGTYLLYTFGTCGCGWLVGWRVVVGGGGGGVFCQVSGTVR